MGWFNSNTKRPERAVASRADAEVQLQRDREDAWRSDRRAVIQQLNAAQRAHAEAQRVYDRYAPGAQKSAAGERLNAAADRLAALEREFEGVNTFAAWSRNH